MDPLGGMNVEAQEFLPDTDSNYNRAGESQEPLFLLHTQTAASTDARFFRACNSTKSNHRRTKYELAKNRFCEFYREGYEKDCH